MTPKISGVVRLQEPLLALTVILLGFAVAMAVTVAAHVSTSEVHRFGMDFVFYRESGQLWLLNGSFYRPHQLGGSYELTLMVDVLYPPAALVLFVPLALVPEPVAALAWWGVPLGLIAYQLLVVRPARWAWPILGAILVWPRTPGAILFGNSDIVMAGILAAALLWRWPAALLIMKPYLAPLALLGVRSRVWWLVALVLAMMSLPLLGDYIASLSNVRGLGHGYVLGALPLLAWPIVVWLGGHEARRGILGRYPEPDGVSA